MLLGREGNSMLDGSVVRDSLGHFIIYIVVGFVVGWRGLTDQKGKVEMLRSRYPVEHVYPCRLLGQVQVHIGGDLLPWNVNSFFLTCTN